MPESSKAQQKQKAGKRNSKRNGKGNKKKGRAVRRQKKADETNDDSDDQGLSDGSNTAVAGDSDTPDPRDADRHLACSHCSIGDGFDGSISDDGSAVTVAGGSKSAAARYEKMLAAEVARCHAIEYDADQSSDSSSSLDTAESIAGSSTIDSDGSLSHGGMHPYHRPGPIYGEVPPRPIYYTMAINLVLSDPRPMGPDPETPTQQEQQAEQQAEQQPEEQPEEQAEQRPEPQPQSNRKNVLRRACCKAKMQMKQGWEMIFDSCINCICCVCCGIRPDEY